MKLIVTMATAVAALAFLSIPLASGGDEHAQRAPRACTQAIEQARTAAGLAGQGFSVAGNMTSLVGKAAIAGYQQDVPALNAITAKLKTNSARLNVLAGRMAVTARKFNVYAARCD